MLFGGSSAPAEHPRAEVVRHDAEQVDLSAVLDWLAAAGCGEVLVEAGPTLTGALFRADLWDEAVIYLAPTVLGDAAMPMARLSIEHLAEAFHGEIRSTVTLGGDLRVVLAPNRQAAP